MGVKVCVQVEEGVGVKVGVMVGVWVGVAVGVRVGVSVGVKVQVAMAKVTEFETRTLTGGESGWRSKLLVTAPEEEHSAVPHQVIAPVGLLKRVPGKLQPNVGPGLKLTVPPPCRAPAVDWPA